MKTEIMKKRRESVKGAGEKKRFVVHVTRYVCLWWSMNKTLSVLVVVSKRAALERLLSLLGYDLAARWTKAEVCTELAEELRNQMVETPMKLEAESWLYVLRA